MLAPLSFIAVSSTCDAGGKLAVYVLEPEHPVTQGGMNNFKERTAQVSKQFYSWSPEYNMYVAWPFVSGKSELYRYSESSHQSTEVGGKGIAHG